MQRWQAKLKDCLCLNFAIEAKEIKRLLPRGTEVDFRRFRGKKYGFFSLFFFYCSSFSHGSISWPSLRFPAALLQFYIRDFSDNPSIYLGRVYSPRFAGYLGRWVLNLPIRKLSFSYPTQANPGGKFRWIIENTGTGNIQCKIESQSGINDYLGEMFESPHRLNNFLFQRTYYYYAAGSEGVYQLQPETYLEKIYPVTVKNRELGFIASDLERHSFPQARNSCFYLPALKFDLKGPEFVNINRLTG